MPIIKNEKSQLLFSDYVSDQKASVSNRSIFKEVKQGYDADQDKLIDEMQYEMGIKRRPHAPKREAEFKVKMFNLTNNTHADAKLYCRLYNESNRFAVSYEKDFWSPLGEYLVFVRYFEFKEPIKKEEVKDEKGSTDSATTVT